MQLKQCNAESEYIAMLRVLRRTLKLQQTYPKIQHSDQDFILRTNGYVQEAWLQFITSLRTYGSVVREYTVRTLQVQYRTIHALHSNITQYVDI